MVYLRVQISFPAFFLCSLHRPWWTLSAFRFHTIRKLYAKIFYYYFFLQLNYGFKREAPAPRYRQTLHKWLPVGLSPEPGPGDQIVSECDTVVSLQQRV